MSETERLREQAALPACVVSLSLADKAWQVLAAESGEVIASIPAPTQWEGEGQAIPEARAMLVAALPALLDTIERAERERDSLRAQLDTVADAYRALLAGQPAPEYAGPVLSEQGRAALDRLRPRRGNAAELRAQLLATYDAYRTLLDDAGEATAALRARVAELEAIIAGRTTPPTDAEIEAVSGETGDSDTPEALLEMARVEIGAAESVLKGTRLVRGDPSRHSAEDAEDLVGAIRLCIGVMEHAANAALAIRAEAFGLTDSCGSEYRMRVENVAYEAATYASQASKEVWAAEAARAEELEAYEGCTAARERCLCPWHDQERRRPAREAWCRAKMAEVPRG